LAYVLQHGTPQQRHEKYATKHQARFEILKISKPKFRPIAQLCAPFVPPRDQTPL